MLADFAGLKASALKQKLASPLGPAAFLPFFSFLHDGSNTREYTKIGQVSESLTICWASGVSEDTR